jgi:hypothetical protein
VDTAPKDKSGQLGVRPETTKQRERWERAARREQRTISAWARLALDARAAQTLSSGAPPLPPLELTREEEEFLALYRDLSSEAPAALKDLLRIAHALHSRPDLRGPIAALAQLLGPTALATTAGTEARGSRRRRE